MFLSSFVFAGGSSQPVSTQNETGIITSDVATSFQTVAGYIVGVEGDTLVCRYNEWFTSNAFGTTCKDKDGNNKWQRTKDAIPPGKTYVGFKVQSVGGHKDLIVFWK